MQQVQPDAKGKWGVLNGQQMVEHFIDALRNASGKLILPQITPDAQLPQFREFMLSEKPFKENTKNPLMSDEPAAVRYASINEAVEKLQKELDYFFAAFENDAALTTGNAFFGNLNFEENVHLLHKHAMHHLKQFGIVD